MFKKLSIIFCTAILLTAFSSCSKKGNITFDDVHKNTDEASTTEAIENTNNAEGSVGDIDLDEVHFMEIPAAAKFKMDAGVKIKNENDAVEVARNVLKISNERLTLKFLKSGENDLQRWYDIQQRYDDIPVYSANIRLLVYKLDDRGDSIVNTVVEGKFPESKPTLTGEEAEETARKSYPNFANPKIELYYVPFGKDIHLSYMVYDLRYLVAIDAHSGELLLSYSLES